jgi:hypothetical protein
MHTFRKRLIAFFVTVALANGVAESGQIPGISVSAGGPMRLLKAAPL